MRRNDRRFVQRFLFPLAGFAFLSAIASTGCRDGGGSGGGTNTPGSSAFGMETREVVTTLRFPSTGAQPSDLVPVDAFPSLTFSQPVLLTAPPDGTNRICVVEKSGTVRMFPNSSAAASTALFLDVSTEIISTGEEGLLGLAFDPHFTQNGYVYVYYTVLSPRRSVVARYTVPSTDPNRADPSTRRILLEVEQPYGNHKAGMIAFGPDNLLYIALGDGGSGGDPHDHGQDLTTLLGSILRIRPEPDGTYTIPSDNPFVGRGGGVREEIWAYGLRNPWRFSFDRRDGNLWVGDVGQGIWEEVSVAESGDNLGWRIYEGNHEFNNPNNVPLSAFKGPIVEYSHSLGTAVIGGYIYRGTRLTTMRGVYLYGDNGSGRIWALVHSNFALVSNRQVASVPSLSSFGEDESGELYAVSLGGKLYRFAETAPAPTVFPALLSETGLFRSTGTLEPQPGVIEFAINHEHWVDGAAMRRWIAVPRLDRIDFDATGPWSFPEGTVIVKHFEIETTPGVPSSTVRLETRVLILEESGWAGYTYRWNDAGTDAALLPGADARALTIQEPGGPRSQNWSFPSRNDCFRCHTAAAGSILGVRARQLNRDLAFPLRSDNQLRTWNHIVLFTTDIGPADRFGVIAAFDDATLSLEERSRAYLEVNCAHCHLPGGPAPGDMDLRLDSPRSSMALFEVRPISGDLGLPDAYRAKSGVKESSVLWERLRRTDDKRMPPLATSVIDGEAVATLGMWIDASGP